MKRREFITKSSLLGASVPIGLAAPTLLSSCSGNSNKSASKRQTPEELGMYSFVDIAPDGKPLKAALVGCGDRGTGAAINFLSASQYLYCGISGCFSR